MLSFEAASKKNINNYVKRLLSVSTNYLRLESHFMYFIQTM